jgi:hypothetical protein
MKTGEFVNVGGYLFLFKWLNRRSQRRSMTKKTFTERWHTWDLPIARIVEEYPKNGLTPPPRPA